MKLTTEMRLVVASAVLVVLVIALATFLNWRKAELLEAYQEGECGTRKCPVKGYTKLLWHKGEQAHKCVCIVAPVDGGL